MSDYFLKQLIVTIAVGLGIVGVFTVSGYARTNYVDVDDGLINIQDIQAYVNHILGRQDWGEAVDVNGDGGVNVLDVQKIVNVILGE